MPWGGTYTVTADIGFFAGMRLDDTDGYATLGDPLCKLYDNIVDVDITDDVQEVVITRGRTDPLSDFNAATCVISLIDSERKYDPVNTASPYYNATTGTSGVTIRRTVKVFYGQTHLFTGRITDIDVSFEPTSTPISRSYVTIEASDDFVLLANARVEELNPSAQLGGARITTLLNLPEISYQGTTDLDTGTITLDTEPIPDQTVLLDYLQQIARTEQGYLFIKGNGALRFSDRLVPAEPVNPFFFSDDGNGDADYETLSVMYGQEQLYNRFVCTPVNSITPGIADDAASQEAYGVATLLLDNLLCSDADAQDLADYLLPLYKDPQYRFDSVSVSFMGAKLSTAVQQEIMDLDLGSLVKVKKTFAVGTPTSISQYLSVEGIRHAITPTSHNILFNTAVREVLPFSRTATGSGTGSHSSATWEDINIKTATGTGTSSQSATRLVARLRSATGSGTGTQSAVWVRQWVLDDPTKGQLDNNNAVT